MDKSGHDSWIKSFYSQLIIFSKNSCTCFPCSDEETADDLPEDTSLWVAKSEQDTVMSQPIWCTIDWLGTQQYRELGRVSRSRVLLWLFTSLQASPEPSNHRRGWVWVFSWHWIHGFYTNHPIPNIQQAATVHWLLIPYLWSLGQCQGWGIKNALTSDASHVFSSCHASDQVTKT